MIEMTGIQDRKMITGIALVVTFISIIGCIEIKKPGNIIGRDLAA